MPRPGGAAAGFAPEAAELIARAKLGGRIGFVVADATTGAVLESQAPDVPLPPASVAKTATALYGLSTLGAEHRFETRLLATGPVKDGRLEGDLLLVGSGDPVLDTDDLAGLVARLKAAGLREVAGRFLIHAGALPYVRSIDPSQPDHVGYNPAISGLNLNFNRVYFQWARAGNDWTVSMDARSDTLRPAVTVAKMAVVNREVPVYTYRDARGVDEWTVASAALGNGGSRWLPVRRPDLYAGEVLQVIARGQGIRLPRPEAAFAPPGGTVIAGHESASLSAIVRLMLKYSTNLTAEVIGLTASQARAPGTVSLRSSAGAMNAWMRTELGARTARFVDHSGLGGESRISAGDMVNMLVRTGPGGVLHSHMKEVPATDDAGRADPSARYVIHAKTGTLNFVSSLAGYVTPATGTPLAFAIFSADTERRARIAPEDMERPDGARAWSGSARRLQQALIRRWATVYAS